MAQQDGSAKKRIFCSYSQKDAELLRELNAHLSPLTRRGIAIAWSDEHITPGSKWEDDLWTNLDAADIVLLLVSPDFLASDFCDRETLRALKREANSSARVIPIIVRPCHWEKSKWATLAALPRGGVPVTTFTDHDAAWLEIVAAIDGMIESMSTDIEQSSAPRAEMPRNELPEAKRPSLPVMLDEGAMAPGSSFYVERTEERRVKEHLAGGGGVATIKGHAQSGKSSLLARLHAEAPRSCWIDFRDIALRYRRFPDELAQEMGRRIAESIQLSDWESGWSSRQTGMDNLTSLMHATVLTQEAKFQLLLDQADQVFEFAESSHDLFTKLKTWYDRRATSADQRWQRLDLVVAHSTNPALWIRDINQSPFTVGLRVELSDLDQTQVEHLNQLHGSPLSTDSDVKTLMSVVGGHPYLVRLSLYWLATNREKLVAILEDATSENGLYSSHLRQKLNIVLEGDEVKRAILQILARGVCDDVIVFQRLWSSGIVRGPDRENARIRYRLYEDYFRRILL